MLPDRMEEALDSAATKQLSEEARREVRSVVIAADVDRRFCWWKRSVPLWQMAAACVVASVLSFVAARSGSLDLGSVPPRSSDVVARGEPASGGGANSVSSTAIRFEHRPAYRPDITRWRPVAANVKGV